MKHIRFRKICQLISFVEHWSPILVFKMIYCLAAMQVPVQCQPADILERSYQEILNPLPVSSFNIQTDFSLLGSSLKIYCFGVKYTQDFSPKAFYLTIIKRHEFNICAEYFDFL